MAANATVRSLEGGSCGRGCCGASLSVSDEAYRYGFVSHPLFNELCLLTSFKLYKETKFEPAGIDKHSFVSAVPCGRQHASLCGCSWKRQRTPVHRSRLKVSLWCPLQSSGCVGRGRNRCCAQHKSLTGAPQRLPTRAVPTQGKQQFHVWAIKPKTGTL